MQVPSENFLLDISPQPPTSPFVDSDYVLLLPECSELCRRPRGWLCRQSLHRCNSVGVELFFFPRTPRQLHSSISFSEKSSLTRAKAKFCSEHEPAFNSITLCGVRSGGVVFEDERCGVRYMDGGPVRRRCGWSWWSGNRKGRSRGWSCVS